MNVKDKIEVVRDILNDVTATDTNRKVVLQISQEVDKYIVRYYKESFKENHSYK